MDRRTELGQLLYFALTSYEFSDWAVAISVDAPSRKNVDSMAQITAFKEVPTVRNDSAVDWLGRVGRANAANGKFALADVPMSG